MLKINNQFLFISLLFGVSIGYGQVIVTHNSPQTISRLSDIFNLTIENNLGITAYFYTEVEISEVNYGHLGISPSN